PPGVGHASDQATVVDQGRRRHPPRWTHREKDTPHTARVRTLESHTRTGDDTHPARPVPDQPPQTLTERSGGVRRGGPPAGARTRPAPPWWGCPAARSAPPPPPAPTSGPSPAPAPAPGGRSAGRARRRAPHH